MKIQFLVTVDYEFDGDMDGFNADTLEFAIAGRIPGIVRITDELRLFRRGVEIETISFDGMEP